MVVFDLELVPQGPDPENGATNKLEHKTQISQNTAAECGTTWRDVRRLRHGAKTNLRLRCSRQC